MKKSSIKYILLTFVALFLAVGVSSQYVKATPSFFASVSTANATTTVNYLPIGNGTTTLVFDAFGQSIFQAMDTATLETAFSGSSTASVVNIALEYSQNGTDWYQDTLDYGEATTSVNASLTTPLSFNWTFSSTSPGGNGSSNATSTRILKVPTPVRYVRAVYTITGAPGAIWAQFIGKRQTSQ